jgi:hypothetical protein
MKAGSGNPACRKEIATSARQAPPRNDRAEKSFGPLPNCKDAKPVGVVSVGRAVAAAKR